MSFVTWVLFGLMLKVLSNIVPVTETHHLLSAELCEDSDQPVSTQRGHSAATAHSGPYKGKTATVNHEIIKR